MKVTKKLLYKAIAVFCALFLVSGVFFILRSQKRNDASVEAFATTPVSEEFSNTELSESNQSDESQSTSSDQTETVHSDIAGETSADGLAMVSAGKAVTNAANTTGSNNILTGSNDVQTGNGSQNNSTTGSSSGSNVTRPTQKPVTESTRPVTQATTAPVISDSNLSEKEQVLALTNQIRQEAGVSDLRLDPALSALADIRAKETVESFSHTRPDGSQFYSVMKENGYSYTASGENIAYGYSTPSLVVTGWKNSSGHYKNMVSSNFGRLGVGVYVQNGTYYWVQLFAN